MMTRLSVLETFNAQNEQAARIILADVERYGGEQAQAVQWAKSFLRRLEREREGSVGPLFATGPRTTG